MEIVILVGVGLGGFLLGWIARASRDSSSSMDQFHKVSRAPALGGGVSFESSGSAPSAAGMRPTSDSMSAAPNATAQPDPNSFQWTQVDSLLKQRNKILAIKVFREQTGTSLKVAKEAVEKRERELRGKK